MQITNFMDKHFYYLLVNILKQLKQYDITQIWQFKHMLLMKLQHQYCIQIACMPFVINFEDCYKFSLIWYNFRS